MNKLLFLFFLCLNVQVGFSQRVKRIYTNNFNAWLAYSGDHKFCRKWGVHLAAQLRRNNFFREAQQYVLRAGINFYFSKEASATVGYGYAESYPYGEFPVAATFPEHRIWEQVQLKNQLSKFEWSGRFRLEQRFSHLPIKNNDEFKAGPAVYTNRVRLLNRFSLPFKGKSIEDKSFYLTAYDEIYINFGKNVGYNILDQNRACFSLGYKVPKAGRVEVGYLHQLIMKSDGIRVENNHTFQIAVYSNINFYKAK